MYFWCNWVILGKTRNNSKITDRILGYSYPSLSKKENYRRPSPGHYCNSQPAIDHSKKTPPSLHSSPLHSENLPRTIKTGSRATSGSRSNTLVTPALDIVSRTEKLPRATIRVNGMIRGSTCMFGIALQINLVPWVLSMAETMEPHYLSKWLLHFITRFHSFCWWEYRDKSIYEKKKIQQMAR